VTILAGESAVVAWNGSDFAKVSNTGGTAVFTTLDVTNLDVTNIRALDGTAAASIANSTGVITLVSNPVLTGGTANGVAYLNASKVLTTGSALTFDGDGNLTLGGATPRILANMSGAKSTRLGIQNSTTNGNTRFYLYPNGTGSITAINGTNNSDVSAANYQEFDLAIIGTTDVRLSSTASGSASFLPLTFYTNGSEQMRLNSTGLGIGTTSPLGKLGVVSGAAPNIATLYVGLSGSNNYYDANTHYFRNGSQVDTMTLTSTGLGIGTSSPSAKLQVADGNILLSNAYSLSARNAANTTSIGLILRNTSDQVVIDADGYGTLIGAGGALNLNSAGNLGLGVTPSASTLRMLQGPNAEFVVAARYPYIASNATNNSGWKYTNTEAASFYVQATGQHQWFNAPSGTAGNTITFTQAMTLDASGNLGVGTSSPSYKLDVAAGDTTSGIGYAARIRGNSTANAGAIQWTNNVASAQWGYIAVDSTFNMKFGGASSELMRIDASGNLGLGVTPSAWQTGANLKALQVGVGAAFFSDTNSAYLGQNVYQDSAGTSKYINTNFASKYQQSFSVHSWHIAPSGTAGNAITFTQAMTLDASGKFMVGTTSAIGSATGTFVAANDVAGIYAGTGAQGLFISANTTSRYVTYTSSGSFAGGHIWNVGNTEAARIDLSGNLLVGTTSTSAYMDGRVSSQASGTQPAFTAKLDPANTNNAQFVCSAWAPFTAGDNVFMSFETETTATIRGTISYNRGAGLVAYNVTSDYRAKDISGPVTDSGALIDSTPVYMGKMKGATQERPMFIAHETPEYAHTGEKDAVDADGNPVYQQMDASALIPVMWAEIQSLRKRLAAAGI
jgi:hypothetical protein